MLRNHSLLLSIALFISSTFLWSCSPVNPKVRIAVNPWPGYELLYLAEKKGFFEQYHLDIELLQLASLADVKRAFEQGRADGMASTMIEVITAARSSEGVLAVILLADYSSGADVIIAKPEIDSIHDLRGKRVGTEFSSLGIYFLSIALEQHGMTLEDIITINIEQLEAESFLFEDKIDAITSYPPFSTPLIKFGYHPIFNSADLKEPITDLITIRKNIIDQDPKWHNRFQQMWQHTYEYMRENPEESYQIMARREGITALDFEQALRLIDIIPGKYQDHLLGSQQLRNQIQRTCQLILNTETSKVDCSTIQHKVVPLPTSLDH